MEVTARAKYIRRTPRKTRLVADLVRGMRVEEALTALQFTPKHAALDVAKAIKSAAANAEHNFSLSMDELFVKAIMVDEGPRIRRFRPASRGMAHPYAHRTCHITVVVEDRPDDSRPTRRRPQQRRAAAPPVGEVDQDLQERETPVAEAPQAEAPEAGQGTEQEREESLAETEEVKAAATAKTGAAARKRGSEEVE
jgi:large subunit ribosomal protein L22